MATNPNENTYILDSESAAEMARLMKQDRLITGGMGGIFPERDDIASMHNILDIACGPGGWILDVAFAYPKTNVAGIDISHTMIDYAAAQAWSQGLDNASFQVMDALKPLEFFDKSFDLVNARFLVAFMPKTAWPKLLQECMRITRPGGIIRLTEFDDPGRTNSLAFEEWRSLTLHATRLAGLNASPDGHDFGIMPILSHLLRSAGLDGVQIKAHAIDFSAEAPAFASMYENCRIAFKGVQPFLIKMGIVTEEEAEQKYQQMLLEMLSNDFCGLWSYLTAWGTKPTS